YVLLSSGTWKEALDVPREKKPRVMSLKELLGAEDDDMSFDDYERIFANDNFTNANQPEAYIMNRSSQNPLEALEDLLYTETSDEASTSGDADPHEDVPPLATAAGTG
ncbi:hypothetical protein C8A03DRAFT_38851, partial [Achaetomium macrosporum]